MPIRILDAATVGRIAAGEVVERPSSVVKELIENSLDAGASSVTVEIRGGGIDYLRVTDNGWGIEPGQVRLAFENHATSKLQHADQLGDIRTLGFRGEALPSIAAVSRVEMTTRAKGQESGMKLNIEGGGSMNLRETGCPQGTTIVMRDLFFNVPVRRAFLKRPSYEGGLVSDAVSRMLLGNPNVSVRFISGGNTLFHSFGDGKLRHAVFAVYGRETAEKMVDIDASEGGARIHGLIGVGELAKTSRAHELFFINGRSVRCPLLARALEQVCRSRVTIGMYPMCVLNLEIPPTSVDVNVHPNKLEVRFRDEDMMRIVCEKLLSQAFENERVLEIEKLVAEQPRVERRSQVREIPLPTALGTRTEGASAAVESAPQGSEDRNAQTSRAKDAPKPEQLRLELTQRSAPPAQVLREDTSSVVRPDIHVKTVDITAGAEDDNQNAAQINGRAEIVTSNVVRPVGRVENDASVATQSAAQAAHTSPTGVQPAARIERGAFNFARPVGRAENDALNVVQPEGEAAHTSLTDVQPAAQIERAASTFVQPAAPADEAPVAPKKTDAPPFRVLGVAFKTYILAETGDTLLLIDQHAAHERLQYERYMARAQAGTASQQLLTPIVAHLSAREMAVVQDNIDTLAEAGYSVEAFGDRDIRISAVPFVLGRAEPKPLFLEMLTTLSQLKAATVDARRSEIMQQACKSAVKAGDNLSDSEIAALIADMMATGAPPTCPHGRPVVKAVTKRELEKLFKRIQ